MNLAVNWSLLVRLSCSVTALKQAVITQVSVIFMTICRIYTELNHVLFNTLSNA
jgi:hypothetical protein